MRNKFKYKSQCDTLTLLPSSLGFPEDNSLMKFMRSNKIAVFKTNMFHEKLYFSLCPCNQLNMNDTIS